MTDGHGKALEAEQSLARLLEFLAQLQSSQQKATVIKAIEKEVEKYLKDCEQKFSSTHSGYLFETISKSNELRKNILKKGTESTYRHYTSQFTEQQDKYTEHLIDNIFPLFGCLYYMYFECNMKCVVIKGGEWRNEKCNGDQGNDLNNWLQDKTQTGTERMIKRGFRGIPLSEKKGTELFGTSDYDGLLSYQYGAQLQNALYYMLFLPRRWNRGQTAYALLFLEEFCNKVTGGEEFFEDQKHDGISTYALKSSCTALKDKLIAITKSVIIAPVSQNPSVKYNEILEAKHIMSYLIWLGRNLKGFIGSLRDMYSDVTNWDKDKLKESETFGPFPWGFVFKDQNWTSGGGLQEKLKEALSELITELQTFQRALDKIEPVSSSAATVGGVLGGLGTLGAAGAAGAAAAYSGLLGPVAEGIGRFFKGLFI